MFFRIKTAGNRRYLQIVENRRDGRATRQSVVATLGAVEEMQRSGGLDALLRSGARLCEGSMLLSPGRSGLTDSVRVRRIGAPLVFDRLWREIGCRRIIEDLLGAHRPGLAIERAIFATVLHRLLAPGSQRACERWLEDYRIDGIEAPSPQLLYRAMAWLGESRPAATPRGTKDLVEEGLAGSRSADADAAIALLYATCLSLSDVGGEPAAPQGRQKTRDAAPRQVVVIIALDRDGWPLCCEIAPASAVEAGLLLPLVERLRSRFGVARACLVADRGSIGGGLLAGLEQHGIEYILGGYQRSDPEIRDIVLRETAPRRGRQSKLEVREAVIGPPGEAGQRRYVICRNEPQARRDAAARAALLAALDQRLRQGETEFAGNPGFRRFLAMARDGRLTIDRERVAGDARFDGLSVLRAGTALSGEAIAIAHGRAARVGASLRTAKAILDARAIYRRNDAAVVGQLFCSFLALRLRHALEARLAALGADLDWGELARDLDRVHEAEARQGTKRFALRSEAAGCAGSVFAAAGVDWPPRVAPPSTVARRPARRSRPTATAPP